MSKRPPHGRDADTGPDKRKTARATPQPDDLALWHHTARSVKPLKKAKPRVPEVGAPSEAKAKPHPATVREPSPVSGPNKQTSKPAQSAAPPRTALPKAPPPIVPIERRKARRIARGHVEIDDRLDLHGLRQADAERRLRTFILRARAEGLRTILIITGKGSARDSEDSFASPDRSERGVLKRSVPLWLEAPELRDCVAGIAPAHIRHGGSGALYIHLRKMRGR
jgi:DNA-nicking Smr family endonuclease